MLTRNLTNVIVRVSMPFLVGYSFPEIACTWHPHSPQILSRNEAAVSQVGCHVYASANSGSNLRTEHAHAKLIQRHRSRKHAFSRWLLFP